MPRIRTYGLDADTIAFAARVKTGSGKTILPENLKQLNKFIIGTKKLGLWNTMVCWPMRSVHNAGTGSTVYSLGGMGIYNGSMVNGPTWGNNGMAFPITNSYIDALNTAIISSGAGPFSTGVIAKSSNASTSDGSFRTLIAKASIFNLGFNQFNLGARNLGYNGLLFRLWADTLYSTNQISNLWNNQFKVIQVEATSGSPYRLKTSGITSGISSHTNVYNLQNDLNIRIGGNSYGVPSWDGQISFAFYSKKIGYMALIETLLKQTIGTGLNMPY